MSQENKQHIENTLTRSLGLKEAVTITVGTVIGVGLFTVGANGVGYLGPIVFLATLLALLVSIFPALMYAEMGAALPYSGGTYTYATEGLGKLWGMLAGWNFIIALIAVASGEALAFSFYFTTLFDALGFNFAVDERIIASLVIIVFMYTNWKGVEMTGRLQNGFVFFFWGVAIVWFISMISKIDLSLYTPFVSPAGSDVSTFIFATSLIWWCFAGFETCCAMGEEIKHPQVNIPRAMFLTPFIVFSVTAIFQWFLLGIVPKESLHIIAEATAPYAEGMKLAGILGFPLILLTAGIAFGGDFSTLNASVAAPARYLYSMSRDGVLPSFFNQLHPKYKTPTNAIMFLGILTLGFIATGSIIYIASLSLFADLFYYIIGFAAAMGLRKKRPDLERPYRAPAINTGAVLSILVYLVMMSQLPKDAFITGVIWLVLGVIMYFIWTASPRGKKALEEGEKIKIELSVPPMPNEEEQLALDKEYRVWKVVVIIAVVVTLCLYASPYLLV